MKRYLYGSILLLLIVTLTCAFSPHASLYKILQALLWSTFSLLMLNFYLIHTKRLTSSLSSGLLIFLFIFLAIFTIYTDPDLGFSAINDMITSALLILSLLLALIIYLINQNILSSHKAIKIIEKIPNYIPFSHTLKKYLLSLIKIEYKIIVLIRHLNDKNYQWTLTQIAAYNHILKNNSTLFDLKEEGKIKFIFVEKDINEINYLIHHLNTTKYRYIIITSLSEIFRDSILSRELLPKEQREAIQIIGSLSSINDQNIEKIIDRDDNIIRIFPPDYDEAKTAVEFIFSKIKSAICVEENCPHHHQKNNIIILHNGTYGRAVRDQFEHYYQKELNNIYINTIHGMDATDLRKSIGFYSFDYMRHNMVVDDKIKNLHSFTSFLNKEWQGCKNYFFIIGYEPNISNILKFMDQEFLKAPPIEKCLLFCGTVSMNSWRLSIIHTLKSTQSLKKLIHKSYYLKLLIYNSQHKTLIHEESKNLEIEFYRTNPTQKRLEKVDIEENLKNIQNNNDPRDIQTQLNDYLQKEESYISIFSNLSLLTALYSINHRVSLLKSKSNVLYEYKDEINILVNGDSINQYVISNLES